MVTQKNSSDLDVGRRPKHESDEFFGVTIQVEEIISILCLKPPKQVVQLLAARPHGAVWTSCCKPQVRFFFDEGVTTDQGSRAMWHAGMQFSLAQVLGYPLGKQSASFSWEDWHELESVAFTCCSDDGSVIPATASASYSGALWYRSDLPNLAS